MKNGMLTIMKKELARFFGDKRMAVTTLLLPGLLIFVMYNFMGSALSNMYSVDDNYVPKISAVHLPDFMRSSGMEINEIAPGQLSDAKKQLENKELDLCVVFPENFEQEVIAYEPSSQEKAPNVEMYFNTTSTTSQTAYTMMTAFLDKFESGMANKFDINNTENTYDMASEKDTAGSIFASMLPMLLMIFLFSGCLAVAPESIAGEKERGTIATMLITPIKRSELAMGKISALAIIALLSGVSSAAGTILSLPKLMGGAADGLNVNVYNIGDYLMLGVVILSTVLLLITLISIISAFAKTIKEAQTAVMPLMIIVMVIGITAMFGQGAKTELFYYFIPLYNSVQCMIGIFSFEFLPAQIIVSIVSNLVYTGIGIFVLTKMFNSEKIVFSK